jgi:transcriptional/translational regulatory protein YebC/TACO1
MGRDSDFFFVKASAIKRLRADDDYDFTFQEIYQADLRDDEYNDNYEFYTRDNSLIPWHSLVRCDVPRHHYKEAEAEANEDKEAEEAEDEKEEHVFDLIDMVKDSTEHDDIGDALKFYGEILRAASMLSGEFCYVVIRND